MFGLLRAFVPCSVFQYIYHGDNFMCFRVCFSHCLPFNEIGLCLFCILVVCGVAASEGMLPFIFLLLLLFMWDGIYVLWFGLLSGSIFFQLRCLACLLSSYCPVYNFVCCDPDIPSSSRSRFSHLIVSHHVYFRFLFLASNYSLSWSFNLAGSRFIFSVY